MSPPQFLVSQEGFGELLLYRIAHGQCIRPKICELEQCVTQVLETASVDYLDSVTVYEVMHYSTKIRPCVPKRLWFTAFIDNSTWALSQAHDG